MGKVSCAMEEIKQERRSDSSKAEVFIGRNGKEGETTFFTYPEPDISFFRLCCLACYLMLLLVLCKTL
jgi:hypothetical protein